MSEWRTTGTRCPLDEAPLDMDKCQPCPFFRGASLYTRPADEPQGWRICCNWPRNGVVVAETVVPGIYREAFVALTNGGRIFLIEPRAEPDRDSEPDT